MKKFIYFFVILSVIFIKIQFSFSRDVSFRQEDRDRLIRLEAKFEEIDKRFEQIDKRFEQIDKRFEQIDKRFEQVNKRIDDLITFLWIITGIFTAIMVANIGFAYWDRRTIIRKAKEETIAEIEREGRLKDLINALRELAKTDSALEKVLKQFHLM
jgi:uncharacterized protein YpmB